MLSRWRFCSKLLQINPIFTSVRGLTRFPCLRLVQSSPNLQQFRTKYEKKKSRSARDDDDDDTDFAPDYEDKHIDKHTKVLKITVNSLRADLIVKSGLGIARNKVEALFYESKIRVNGQKLMKKSSPVQVEDEIDVIKGTSQMNPDHLVVQRVEVLATTPKDDGDGIWVTLRRHKSLIIENYEASPYKDNNSE